MRSHRLFVGVSLAIAAAMPARAADPRYPDWPCTQAKVPEISAVALWAGPPLEGAETAWENDQRVKDLTLQLAPRRVPIEDARKRISEFVTGNAGEREEKGKLLFAGLFDRLNRERTEIMNGLERFGRRLKAQAEEIRADISELHGLQDAGNPDEAKLRELASRVEWNTRIFEDRRKTLRYVCEAPTLIERRLFALSRAVQEAME